MGYRYPQHEKALLRALLEPQINCVSEASGDYTARLKGAAGRVKYSAVAIRLGNVLPASRHAGWQPVAGQRSRAYERILSKRS